MKNIFEGEYIICPRYKELKFKSILSTSLTRT